MCVCDVCESLCVPVCDVYECVCMLVYYVHGRFCMYVFVCVISHRCHTHPHTHLWVCFIFVGMFHICEYTYLRMRNISDCVRV